MPGSVQNFGIGYTARSIRIVRKNDGCRRPEEASGRAAEDTAPEAASRPMNPERKIRIARRREKALRAFRFPRAAGAAKDATDRNEKSNQISYSLKDRAGRSLPGRRLALLAPAGYGLRSLSLFALHLHPAVLRSRAVRRPPRQWTASPQSLGKSPLAANRKPSIRPTLYLLIFPAKGTKKPPGRKAGYRKCPNGPLHLEATASETAETRPPYCGMKI